MNDERNGGNVEGTRDEHQRQSATENDAPKTFRRATMGQSLVAVCRSNGGT